MFLLFRAFGPALITIRGSTLDPILRSNDVILARRNTQNLSRGSLVIAGAPLQTGSWIQRQFDRFLPRTSGTRTDAPIGEPVLRIVVGLPGETVSWDHRGVSIGTVRYGNVILDEHLPHPERSVQLDDDEFFLIALRPGRADSRIIGPVDRSSILFRVQSIVWPAERRGVLPLVEDDATY